MCTMLLITEKKVNATIMGLIVLQSVLCDISEGNRGHFITFIIVVKEKFYLSEYCQYTVQRLGNKVTVFH